MLYDIVKEDTFISLMNKHIQELLIYLFDQDQHFGVLCKIEHLSFDPPLPEHISSEFHPMTLFFLAGYTFETARIEEGYLVFEAGFGEENIGSYVTVPLLSIMQIIVDQTPIFINLATMKETIDGEEEVPAVNGVKDSMSAFLSNPENEKFLKKKK
ncbi:MAG: hypothetical protein DRG24_04620 [Epsilonproteobacteria bacterium]|nr:MAG: hypothetical protein DRG24_04620 [Campylobacterota bacterium]